MLNALILPLLFSMCGGTYLYVRFPERRPRALLALTLFQLVGAYGYVMEPTENLFALLSVHAVLVFVLLVRQLQGPKLSAEKLGQ